MSTTRLRLGSGGGEGVANVWDLIVRLAGDGSKLRDDIDQDIGKIEELLAAIKDKDLTVKVDALQADEALDGIKVKVSDLRDAAMAITADDVQANLKLDELKLKADELKDLTMMVNIDDQTTKDDLTLLSAKAEELRLALLAIPVHLLDSEAQLQLDELQAKLDGVHDKTVVVDVVETQNGKVVAPGGAAGGAGTLAGALMTTAPILAPVGGAAIGGIGGLASAVAPGMAGMTGFGALATTEIAPVISAMTQLKAAQLQYNNAVTNAQKLQALKAEQSALANLDAEQRKALVTVEQFVGEWDQYRKQFEPQIVTAFTDALQLLMSFMKSLAPAIKGFATAFITLEQDASKALTSPFWKSFFGYLGGEAKQSTMAFGIGLGNLAKGFAGLLMAFNPLAQTMDRGWISMTASFARWAAHLGATQGFKNFLNDVNKDGPLTLNLIGQLIVLVNNLLRGLEPIGRVMLEVILQLVKWTNELMHAVPWVRQLAGAILIFIGVFKLLGPLVGSGGPWGLLLTAIIVGVIELIAHWNQITHWWSTFVRWIGHLWDGILVPFFKKWGVAALAALAPFIGLPALIYQHWNQISAWFGKLWEGVLRVLSMDLKTIIHSFIALWTEISRLFTGWVKQAEGFGASIVGGIVSGIENAFNSAKQGLMAAWHDVTSLFTGGPSLSVSSGTAAMVHGSTSTINVIHSGSVKVDGLTPKAVQQVNQHLYNSAMRKR